MRILIIVLILFLIASCASGVQKMRKLNPGMSMTEVDKIMERRDSFKTAEKGEDAFTLYQYTNQFCNAHVSLYDKCDFFVIFKNDKVIETGVRNVRSTMPQMQYIHIFQH